MIVIISVGFEWVEFCWDFAPSVIYGCKPECFDPWLGDLCL